MLEYLKWLAARLRGWRPPMHGPSEDPYAGVRQPLKRGPGGRDASAALDEPRPDSCTGARVPGGE